MKNILELVTVLSNGKSHRTVDLLIPGAEFKTKGTDTIITVNNLG